MEPSTPSARQPGKLSCPQCGGDVNPESVRCGYCGSSLATVACPSCYGHLFAGMSHCPWCGAAADQPASHVESPGPCPRCREALQTLTIGQTLLAECRRCGGLWVDNARFEQLCAEREVQESVLGEARASAPTPSRTGGEKLYIPCPQCATLMHRVNFAGCSGVVVDRCKAHGTWFDYQELQRIIRFIRDGGLKKARKKEKEALEEEKARLKAERLQLSLEAARNYGSDDSGRDDGREATILLEALASVWQLLK